MDWQRANQALIKFKLNDHIPTVHQLVLNQCQEREKLSECLIFNLDIEDNKQKAREKWLKTSR